MIPQGRSGIPRPVRVGILLGAALAATALPFFPAFAQEAAPEKIADLRRLKFEKKCYFEEFKGKAEGLFLTRMEGQRKLFLASKKEEIPGFDDLYADCLWTRAMFFKDKNDLDTACTWAKVIYDLERNAPVVSGLLPKVEDLVITYSLKKAAQMEKESNLKAAREQYEKCLKAQNPESRSTAVSGVVRIVKQQQGLKEAIDSQDLMLVVEAIDRIVAELEKTLGDLMAGDYPDIKALKTEQDKYKDGLGNVDLTFQDVIPEFQGESAPLTQAGATFSFTPLGEGGEAWPKEGGSKAVKGKGATLRVGAYDIRVFLASAGPDPVALYLKVVVAKGRLPLTVPGKIPLGMVFVGPFPKGGNFFIDRTEVTVGELKKFADSDPVLSQAYKDSVVEQPSLPAWFPAEDSAHAFEKATTKSIPTVKQWLDAAYGPYSDQERPCPWGTAAPKSGTQFFTDPKAENPRPVGSFPAGRSPYGLDDMVGNVAEWVSKGPGPLWTLGGYFKLREDVVFNSGGKNWARDPAPGEAAFKGVDQGAYSQFRVKEEFINATGLRMVIPVK